ncbi:MAG: hypothetical protein IPK73_02975 [Candidatus Obscuribacter sp.]|nr:hypothetical protein [Candidatus Obscuribacter sp.]MBK9281261.1 hypothetical protein [Candidatus Obscuribacter sp.]
MADFGRSNTDTYIAPPSFNNTLSKQLNQAISSGDRNSDVSESMRTRQGCDAGHALKGMSMGEQLDALRQYQRESKNDSQHLPKIDLKMDQDGKGYEVKAKPNPEENSNKGNKPETILKHREQENGSTAEHSCKNMPLQEKPMQEMPMPSMPSLSTGSDSGSKSGIPETLPAPSSNSSQDNTSAGSDASLPPGSNYNNNQQQGAPPQ